MGLLGVIVAAMQASLFLLVLSLALQSRMSDLGYILRRPGLFLRAIIAVYLMVPVVAVALCLLLPIAPWTKAGVVTMSVSPLAPIAPMKMLNSKVDRAYAMGTYVALMISSVVTVPLTAELLKPLSGDGVSVPIELTGSFVAATVILPLVIGIAAHEYWTELSERAAPIVRLASLLVIIPAALIILIRFARQFAALVGDGTLLAIFLIVVAGLVSGYALAGPDPSRRRALADAATTRHPGLAAAILELKSRDTRSLAAIVLYLFASTLFAAMLRWVVAERRSRKSANKNRRHR